MTIPYNFREIVLDTETTGLNYQGRDRIVDIACLELIDHVPTGKTYQTYINPQRNMSKDATAVSGITDVFLADKPLFHEIVDDFLSFVNGDRLVIHNAKFDVGFLNYELFRIDKPIFNVDDAIDTLEIARKKFPGAPVNLDALCKRFEIDTSARTKHGALVDCFLLADVYLHLLGGRQKGLSFLTDDNATQSKIKVASDPKTPRKSRSFVPSKQELSLHDEFVKQMPSALWDKLTSS